MQLPPMFIELEAALLRVGDLRWVSAAAALIFLKTFMVGVRFQQ
jgi:hypothetical protein